MATRKQAHEADLAVEVDTIFDRGASWIGNHPREVLIAFAALLVIAGGIGIARESQSRAASAAEAQISSVYDAYLVAMGATPGANDVPEPANPELGKNARSEYAAKLLEAANAHDDSAAAVGGRLQAAKMLEANGDAAGAFEARKLAATHAPAGSPVAALALVRHAVALETKGDLKPAAEAFERAGEIDSPARVLALADAARIRAALGESARALELFAQAEKLGIEAVPAHVKQRLIELRSSQPAAE